MARTDGKNNEDHNDEYLEKELIDEKGRNYIYVGVAFTIFAIMATSYLAILVFSGPFVPFNGIEWILNQIPFHDKTFDEAEFEGYSDDSLSITGCSNLYTMIILWPSSYGQF
jgi:hypothetical protein